MSIKKIDGSYLVDLYLKVGNERIRVRRKFKKSKTAKEFEIYCFKNPYDFKRPIKKNKAAYSIGHRIRLNKEKDITLDENNIKIDLDKICLNYKPNNSGIIYFLLMDNIVVYVGQTIKELGCRIDSHKNKYIGKFNNIKYIEVDIREISLIEASFIMFYKPMLNSVTPLKISNNEAMAILKRFS